MPAPLRTLRCNFALEPSRNGVKLQNNVSIGGKVCTERRRWNDSWQARGAEAGCRCAVSSAPGNPRLDPRRLQIHESSAMQYPLPNKHRSMHAHTGLVPSRLCSRPRRWALSSARKLLTSSTNLGLPSESAAPSMWARALHKRRPTLRDSFAWPLRFAGLGRRRARMTRGGTGTLGGPEPIRRC